MGAAICTYGVRRVDPDLFGYLAYGRLFLEQGSVTPADPFAYTSNGSQWVTFEYLAQIVLWLAYHHLGPAGLVLLKCLVGGCAVYLLFLAIRTTSDDPFVWAPVFLLAGATLGRYFLFRPQLFTFAFMAAFVAVVLRFQFRGRAPLWALPLVMLAWANMHGGFLAGIGVLGLAIILRVCETANAHGIWSIRTVFHRTRPLWLTLGASILITFLNPNGPRVWAYVLTEVLHNTNRRFIAEWAPTSLRNDAWSAVAITVVVSVLAIVGTLAHRHVTLIAGIRPWQWLLSCLPLGVMAYLSVRHVPVATIWLAPVLALLASAVRQQVGGTRLFRGGWTILTAAAVAAVLLVAVNVARNPLPSVRMTGTALGTRNPCRVTAFLRQHQLEGNVYNPLWWGSYLSWELYPRVRISMDGRNISLFSREMVLANLIFFTVGPPEADIEAPLRHPTDFLLIPTDSPMVNGVKTDRRWKAIYEDSDAVLLLRADSAHETLMKAFENGLLRSTGEGCPQSLR